MEVSLIQSNPVDQPFTLSEIKKKEKWWHKVLFYILPGRKELNRYVSQIFVGMFLFGILYGMFGDEALPGSEIFGLFVIIIAAMIGGHLIALIKLPPLVGMLLVGFCFRNIHVIPFHRDISKRTIFILREIALSIILFRAGIGLDGKALSKLKAAVFRLTVCPCLTEVMSMGIFGHFILGLPFIFSFMLGFIISAISPEVVLPPLLEYERQRYGVRKGIPALVIGATSLDDIVAIAGFTICFSIAFSTKDLVWTIIKAPLEPIIGFIFSVVFGVLFWYFPKPNTATGILVFYNVCMVAFGSMAAMFLSHRLNMAGSGPLSGIILGFVAAIRWRKDPDQFAGIYETTLMMWSIVEPVLFSLIGAEITVEILHNNAGWAILSLVLSLVFRSIMTYLVTFGCHLNRKEKLFICCSYLPKASVQAAIGSQALDYARSHEKADELSQHGLIVLNVCVLSLLMTAPLAAILIKFLGPVLLTKDDDSHVPVEPKDRSDDEEEAVVDGMRLWTDYSRASLVKMPRSRRNTTLD